MRNTAVAKGGVMTAMTKRMALCVATFLTWTMPAFAQGPFSFEGKTITFVVAYPAGGGTDATARLMAPYLANSLPGNPQVIIQNRPGAQGVIAANYFVQQTKPDGISVLVGGGSITNPLNYRVPEVKYKPSEFAFIGGVGRTGSTILINVEAEKRLYDKKAEPATMGAYGSVPYPSQQITGWGIEFLDWNARWIMAYRGLPDLSLALERGEIDMGSVSNVGLFRRLTESGKFKAIAQTGAMIKGKLTPRPEFGNVPLFADLMKGKIEDPIQQKGFDYWSAQQAVSIWLALAPGTPKEILELYRVAYENLANNSEFMEKSRKIAEDFSIQRGSDLEDAVKAVDSSPQEALDYIAAMLRRQGAAGR